MKEATGSCLAIGAGAIGKSVTGLTFREMGFDVTFVDVREDVIRDINRRKGYRIKTARFKMEDTWQEVTGVSACSVSSDEAEKKAICADYMCTSVGSAGLKTFIPTLVKWLQKRNSVSHKRMYLLFFENEGQCMDMVSHAVKTAMGNIPEWLTMAKASIERMTKALPSDNGEFDVVGERVFPVFLPKETMKDSSIAKDTKRFRLVDDIDAYYYRKLYTNNLGHAALGYAGTYYGYHTSVQTMDDERVSSIMYEALSESGAMLVKTFGFTEEEMREHIEELPTRFWNQGLDDSLVRLARDPIRKIGPEERIIGAMRKCFLKGIEITGICKILCYALRYYNESDEESRLLNKLGKEKGMEWVLENICRISRDEPIYSRILETDKRLALDNY